MSGSLLYCGMTQDRVPVGIRERVQADAARRRELVALAQPHVAGLLVLSTCERFELYADAHTVEAACWTALLARAFSFSTDALAPHLHFRRGEVAARHLLRVSAGLESRIVGEPHILRQVRTAYIDGLEHGELGATLSTLGRTALHVGKRVRRETQLASTGQSITALAIEKLLAGSFSQSSQRRIIVLGTGMLARDALARLARRPYTSVAVVSRGYARAVELAGRFDVDALPLSELPRALRRADALLACSNAAQGFLVQRRCVHSRRQQPLQIVDLGLPRNVDPDLASVPGVQLVQLERLHGFGTAAPAALASAERIVERGLQRFIDWQHGHAQAACIAAVQEGVAATAAQRRDRHVRIRRLKSQVAA
ncbi:MAG TPA: glutamyl-tRNA reductase [Phycisphaerae bacterium]|nr:glutamyl-tRNA reductase [Phycisphaerae bacterium]